MPAGTPFSSVHAGPEWPHGCWPNQEQQLLLRACLDPDQQTAEEAFHEWRRAVPQFFMDSGTPKVIALFFSRMKSWDIPVEEYKRISGMVRYFWTQSQVLNCQLRRLLQIFRQAEIPTLLIKGAALNHSVYTDRSRIMSDLDVVIPRSEVIQAMELLQRHGWRSEFRDPQKLPLVTHACHFVKDRGEQLDLHWGLFHGRPLSEEEESLFWRESLSVPLGEHTSRILCPTDQLLHTCEHGVRYNITPPFRWLIDAALIVRKYRPQIEWDRLAGLARRFDLILPVRETLLYLAENLDVSIPPEALTEISRMRCSRMSRFEHWLRCRKLWGSHSFSRLLPVHLCEYPRYRRQATQLGLTEFLSRVSNLEPPYRQQLRRILRVECSSLLGRLRRMWKRSAARLRFNSSESYFSMAEGNSITLEGFYDPEDHEQQVFRWSCPTAATHVKLHPEADRMTFQLAPYRPLDDGMRDQLKIRVNQSLVSHRDIQFEDGEIIIPITRHMLVDRAAQRVEIRVPAWEEAVGDPRPLGVPLLGLKFREA